MQGGSCLYYFFFVWFIVVYLQCKSLRFYKKSDHLDCFLVNVALSIFLIYLQLCKMNIAYHVV